MKLKDLNAASFLRDFSSIASTVGHSDFRKILTCVNITIDFAAHSITMVSTDSAILTMRRGQLEPENIVNPEGYEKLSLNIPADDFIKALKTFIPKKKKYCIMDISYDWEKDNNAIEVFLDGMPCFKIQLESGDYPLKEQIYANYYDQLSDEKNFRIVTLNTQLLKSLIAYAERMGNDAVKFAFPATPGQQLKPAPFCINQDLGKTFGIITPMRAY